MQKHFHSLFWWYIDIFDIYTHTHTYTHIIYKYNIIHIINLFIYLFINANEYLIYKNASSGEKKSVLSHRRKKNICLKLVWTFLLVNSACSSAYFSPDADKKAMDKQDFSWKQPFEDENIFNNELL